MENDEFEKKLTIMTKPEVDQLKHQDMLAKAIASAKDESVLSLWWLVIPLYIILTLLMKSLFMPEATIGSSLHDMTIKQKFVTYLFFIILPVIFIIINILSIRKVVMLTGNPRIIDSLGTVWLNILLIIFSVCVLIIYIF